MEYFLLIIVFTAFIFAAYKFSQGAKKSDDRIAALEKRIQELEKSMAEEKKARLQSARQQAPGVTIDLDKQAGPEEIKPEEVTPEAAKQTGAAPDVVTEEPRVEEINAELEDIPGTGELQTIEPEKPKTTLETVDSGKVEIEKPEAPLEKESAGLEKSSVDRTPGTPEQASLDKESQKELEEEPKAEEPSRETPASPAAGASEVEKSEAGKSTGEEVVQETVGEEKKEVPPESEHVQVMKQSASTVRMSSPVEQKAKRSFQKPEFWKKIEQRFLENWIGILGAIILVIGISIVAVYAAIEFKQPIFRFALIVGISAGLTALFFVLKRFEYWLQLALWLRSAAGAIFLLACIGAGGIPGIQFIDGIPALLMLLLGIGVNLFLAFIGSREEMASLHVLLSLVSIGFASHASGPEVSTQLVCLIVATLITLFGVFLTFRERWEYHLLFTISCFFIFLVYHRFFSLPQMSNLYKMAGIGSALIGFAGSLLVHYRKAYKTDRFEKRPFIVHMVAWIFLGVSMLVYAPGMDFVSIPIAVSAIVIFLIARFAKKRGIRWLYITDTLIAQLTFFIAILALFKVNVQPVSIMGVLFLELLIFSFIMRLEKEPKLYLLGTFLQNILSVVLAITAFVSVSQNNGALILQYSFITAICAASWAVFRLYALKKPDSAFDPPLPQAIGEQKIALFYKASCAGAGLFAFISLGLLLLHRFEIFTAFNGSYILLAGTILFLCQRNRFADRRFFLTDTIIALVTSYITAALMYRYSVHVFHIVFIMYIISGFSLFIMNGIKEQGFIKAAAIIKNLLTFVLTVMAFTLIEPGQMRILYNAAFFLGIGTALSVLYKLYRLNIEKASGQGSDSPNGEKLHERLKTFWQVTLGGVTFITAVNLLLFLLYESFSFIPQLPGHYLLLLSALMFLAVREGLGKNRLAQIDKALTLAALYGSALLLLRWDVHIFHILFICQLISLAVSGVMRVLQDKTYHFAGQVIGNLLILLLPLVGFTAFSFDSERMLYNASFFLCLNAFITMTFHFFILKTRVPSFTPEDHRLSAARRMQSSLIYAGMSLTAALITLVLFLRYPGSGFIQSIRGEFVLLFCAVIALPARQRFIKKLHFQVDTAAVIVTSCLTTLFLLAFDVPIFYIFLLMAVQTYGYALYMRFIKENRLFTGITVGANVLTGLLCLTGFIVVLDSDSTQLGLHYSMGILGAAAAAALFNSGLLFRYDDKFDRYQGSLSREKRLLYHIAGAAFSLAGIIAVLIISIIYEKATILRNLDGIYFLYGASLAALIIRPQVPFNSIKTGLGFGAQILSYILAFCLVSSGTSFVLILSLCFFSTVIFALPHMYSGNIRFYSFENYLLFFIIILQVLAFTVPVLTGDHTTALFQNAGLLFASLVVLVAYLLFGYRKMKLKEVVGPDVVIKPEDKEKTFIFSGFELLGYAAPALLTVIHLLLLNDLPWMQSINSEYLLLLPAAALIFIRDRFGFRGMGVGLLLMLAICHIAAWINIWQSGLFGGAAVLYSLPLFILDLLAIRFSTVKTTAIKAIMTSLGFTGQPVFAAGQQPEGAAPEESRFPGEAEGQDTTQSESAENQWQSVLWPGIYLFFIHLSFTVYFAAKPVTPLILGPFWLVCSIILLEGAAALRRRFGEKITRWGNADLHLIVSGYGMLVGFLSRYIRIHLMSHDYIIGTFSVQHVIGIFGLAVLVYWFFHKKPVEGAYYKLYEAIQPFLLEISIIFFVILAAFFPFSNDYLPFIWALCSIAAVILGVKVGGKLSRLQLYSVFSFWATLFHIDFLISPLKGMEKITTFQADWFMAVLSIVLLFVFLVLFYKWVDLKNIQLPRALRFFKKLSLLIESKKHYWVYFPLFIGIALFLIWSFDEALTFLLIAEAVAFFIVSVVVRDNLFRYLSYVGILVCLGRLVLYDFQHAPPLVKGLICIGVAVQLLGMNAIYKKYKERFKKEEKETASEG